MVTQLAGPLTVSGSALEICATGVYLTGDSGSGKSDLALALISAGHYLVADDAVLIDRLDNRLIARAPTNIRGLLAIRGLGIVDICRQLGPQCCKTQTHLQLIIHLQHWPTKRWQIMHRLDSLRTTATLLGLPLPKYILPLGEGRPLLPLIELYVKQHLQSTSNVMSMQC